MIAAQRVRYVALRAHGRLRRAPAEVAGQGRRVAGPLLADPVARAIYAEYANATRRKRRTARREASLFDQWLLHEVMEVNGDARKHRAHGSTQQAAGRPRPGVPT